MTGTRDADCTSLPYLFDLRVNKSCNNGHIPAKPERTNYLFVLKTEKKGPAADFPGAF